MKDLAAHLSALERDLGQAVPEELPGFLGEVEKLRARAWTRLMSAAANGQTRGPEEADQLLDVNEAARRLGTSTDHLYRDKRLPFRVHVGRRVRFSARGIERYIRQRQGR